MSAAVFGLIGVIAGALLAGLVYARLDRRDRFRKGQVAGLLITGELQVAAESLMGIDHRAV